MKRKVYILILTGLIQHCIVFSQNVGIADSIYFYKAVDEGIKKYINKIPLGKEKDFGFNSHDEFSEILIEKPMQIYNFTDYSFQSSDIPNLFQPLKRWTVPLSINHEYKCFIDITLADDGYKAVGFGSAILATDLNDFENNKNLKNVKRKSIFLDYALNVYCIVMNDRYGNLEFYPFRSVNQCESMLTKEKDKYSTSEIVDILKTNNKKLKNDL